MPGAVSTKPAPKTTKDRSAEKPATKLPRRKPVAEDAGFAFNFFRAPEETESRAQKGPVASGDDESALSAAPPSTKPKPGAPIPTGAFKKALKAQRKAERNKRRDSSDPCLRIAHLAYLHDFVNDRQNWKFSKTRQNALLARVLDPVRIPNSMDSMLVKYLHGLQGAARNRLKGHAERVVDGKPPIGDAAKLFGADSDDAEKKKDELSPEAIAAIHARGVLILAALEYSS